MITRRFLPQWAAAATAYSAPGFQAAHAENAPASPIRDPSTGSARRHGPVSANARARLTRSRPAAPSDKDRR